MKKIECVIMDWAGTAVDYGCFAPVAAFLKAFGEVGITVTMEEARRPMGMAKIDHIRELFKLPGVTEQFQKLYNRLWTEEDVVAMNREFEKYLFASLQEYTTPIPGVIETIGELKKAGIKIGSTTGYTRAMMDVVLPGAAAKGYTTDNCVTPDGLPAGRPQPFMIYKNMTDLNVPSVTSVVKYGDTIADIKEGVNAGVWTVGVILGSNEMGWYLKNFPELTGISKVAPLSVTLFEKPAIVSQETLSFDPRTEPVVIPLCPELDEVVIVSFLSFSGSGL